MSACDDVRRAAASVRGEQGGSGDKQVAFGGLLADEDFDADRGGGEDDGAMVDRPEWLRNDMYYLW